MTVVLTLLLIVPTSESRDHVYDVICPNKDVRFGGMY